VGSPNPSILQSKNLSPPSNFLSFVAYLVSIHLLSVLRLHLSHGAAAVARPHQHERADPDQLLKHGLREGLPAEHLRQRIVQCTARCHTKRRRPVSYKGD
jgi:hypothetical protein